MRLWSIHPRYLDRAGLLALWREGLLAQKVLAGGTKGYTRHPQLIRFKESGSPMAAIASFLQEVWAEADRRGYRFNRVLITGRPRRDLRLPVTAGQMAYERDHLLAKLLKRDQTRYRVLKEIQTPAPHPLFFPEAGPVADWERTP